MRSWLGRVAVVTLAAGSLVALAPGVDAAPAASSPPTSAPPSSAAPTTAVTTTTTTITTPPSTAASTTASTTASTSTTNPPVDLVVELPPPPVRVTPRRGTQIQVTPTDPPPPTTTTTTLPPAWALPDGTGSGRRVVYSKSRQRVWTVEANGAVSKTHLVSGRLTWDQPRPGTYHVFSRSSYTCNIKNPHICWRYMVRFAKGGGGDNIGFHEIPTDTRTGRRVQSESQLGIPLSGGCVRQRTSDAQYMWAWAPVGTKVVVLG